MVLNKISRIFHLADLHVRNYHRHTETREVFEETFKKFDELIIPNETVICLAGDIAHSKNEISPELVSLIVYLLKECTKRCPTILIPGNHDANLSNEYRMDVLTPIVESLNDPNLYYWKDTGVYELGDIAFSHFSVFGSSNKWIPAGKMKTEKDYKIILHHGAVNGAVTDLEYNIENETVKVSRFDGADLVLLGDIHKRQILQEYQELKNGKKKPIIKYCGSLYQQDHGEDLIHGFVSWDVRERYPTFIPIENNYGYYTACLLDNKFLNKVENLPKNLRLRIFYENCTKDYIDKILNSIRRKHNILDVVIRDQKPKTVFTIDGKQLTHTNSRDVEFQNSMLKIFFENENIIDIDLDFLRFYNRTLNSKILSDVSVIRNVQWKPKSFEFSNMFSYGKNNYINFEKLDKVNGLYAKNASGKSSFLDSVVFTIFDKCTRTYKASHVMNNKSTEFSGKFIFEMEGKELIIERVGVLNEKTNAVRVDVLFKSIENGIETDLTGIDRDDTNKIIRNYVGTYEDFLTTTLTSQNDPKSIIDMSQRERNELFCKFLDIQIYSELYQLCKDDTKIALQKIKELEKLDIDVKLSEFELIREELEKDISEIETNLIELKKNNKILQDTIIQLSLKVQNIGITINLEDCEKELKLNEDTLAKEIIEIKEIKTKIKSLEISEIEKQVEIKNYDEDKLKKSNEEYQINQKRIQKLYIDITKINTEIKNRNEKVEHLKDHEYNPDCEYCLQNSFVIDAKKAEEELVDLLVRKLELNGNIDSYKEESSRLQIDIENYSKLSALKTNLTKIQSDLQIFKNQMDSKMYRGRMFKTKITEIEDKIVLYYENENIIKSNREFQLQITEKQKESELLTHKIDKEVNNLIILKSNLSKKLVQIEEYNNHKKELSKIRFESSNYEYYCQAMSKDGIPNILLNDALPLIENEVNNILGQIVDFTIKLETTEKNNISGSIVYDMKEVWPMEMTSGMEKFILSMAFRVGMMNITTLPIADFMAIDEGFGVLDSDKLNNIYLLFDYLKSKFSFVLCISHIDAMKDMVDSTIPLEKVNGVSIIRY